MATERMVENCILKECVLKILERVKFEYGRRSEGEREGVIWVREKRDFIRKELFYTFSPQTNPIARTLWRLFHK